MTKQNILPLTGPSLPPESGKAKSLVVFLHGYGANGADLLSIGEAWADGLPDTAFAAPNAPEVCEAWSAGYQWFPLRPIGPDGVKAAARGDMIGKPVAALNAYLDEQLKTWDVAEKNLVVAGFSQGAMMTMYAMPRRKAPCAGIIGWSGLLIDGEGLKKPGIVKMPVLAMHGDSDELVDPASLDGVQKGFEAAGFQIETILRPDLGHGIDAFGAARSLSFIQEVLVLTS